MDSIIKRLAEIEETAEAIVENAEKQKFEEERKIQEERCGVGWVERIWEGA